MRGNGNIVLDPRLSQIAELVGKCEDCADIGCDHGRLGAFLLQSGRCRSMQLIDVSEPSLRKAAKLIESLGLSERAHFIVGDGARGLIRKPDVAVIAGMGGATIAEIIREGRMRLGGARLVLQPNVAAPQLRRALSKAGYGITDERVALDGRRCYVIIAAEPGTNEYTDRELTVGPVLLQSMPRELAPYARFRLRVAKEAAKGASASNDISQIGPWVREIEIWEDVLACLARLHRC